MELPSTESCPGPSRERILAVGEEVIREGEFGDTAFYIVSGEVSIWKHTDTGTLELARLGAGQIFGEMSMVDEKPRSASVTALQPTCLKEVKRAEFLQCFQTDPAFAASLLRVLFERLRETGAKLTQLQNQSLNAAWPQAFDLGDMVATAPAVMTSREIASGAGVAARPEVTFAAGPLRVSIEGLSQPACGALPSNPYVIEKLPCRIGRTSQDALSYNDLTIHDFEPYQVSINHLLIFEEKDPAGAGSRIGIFDRGSARGSWLNHCQLGGLMGDDSATYLGLGTSELVLGDQDSQFRFRITVAAA